MIHIALTIDHKFVRYCAVTIVSILKNNNAKNISFHIVMQDLSQTDCNVLTDLIHSYGATIAFYDVPNDKIKDYKIQWEGHRLSMVVFYRLILPSILPQSISKVFYLDSDILVLGSLEDFWNTNLEELAIAGIQDTVRPHPTYFERLQYDTKYSYFNGGVLLLNLDYWRKYNIEKQCLIYFQQYQERVVCNDQDILNALLHDKKVLVEMKWNVQDDLYRVSSYSSPAWKPSYTDAILHPAILHYCGRKPWAYHCMHPLRHLFFEYQKLTPYNDWKAMNKTKTLIHRFIHLLPYTLGIKRKKYIDLMRVKDNTNQNL